VDVSDDLWASEEWIPTSLDRHPWLRENKEEIGPWSNDRRWFVPRGHRWPLLCLTVYPAYSRPPVGVLISASYKVGADGWFTDCNLPRALVPTLIEMLVELR